MTLHLVRITRALPNRVLIEPRTTNSSSRTSIMTKTDYLISRILRSKTRTQQITHRLHLLYGHHRTHMQSANQRARCSRLRYDIHPHYGSTLISTGPCTTHFANSGRQDQLRGSSIPAQHCCVHAAASSCCGWHLGHGNEALQHFGSVCGHFKGPRTSSDSRSALAPLHSLDYIPPSLIALAARKIYPHRIVITAPENERSMQWGSSLEAVKAVLDGVTVEDVVEEVLQSVEVPL